MSYLCDAGLILREGKDLKVLLQLISLEWEAFDQVHHIEQRASCQDKLEEFLVMRLAQYLNVSPTLCALILSEWIQAMGEKRNLIEEKYALMMRVSDPELYAQLWEAKFSKHSPVKEQVLFDILQLIEEQQAELAGMEALEAHARPKSSVGQRVSARDYLGAEFSLYSLSTLYQFKKELEQRSASWGVGSNFVFGIYRLSLELHKALADKTLKI